MKENNFTLFFIGRLIMLGFCLFCFSGLFGQNILNNPGFEEKLKGWDDWGNLSFDSTSMHGGKYALKIGSGGGGTGQGITTGFSIGQKLTLTAYAKLSGKITPWHASICIQFIDKEGKKTNFSSSDVSDSVAYQLKTVTATIPAGTVKILPNIWYDGFGKVSVLVDDFELVAATVAVADIAIKPLKLSLAASATAQLTDSIIPTNASNQNVSWSSSDSTVAKVSSTGLVTGKTPGTAIITVTSLDGSKKATSEITVNAANLITNAGFEEKLKGWDDWGGLSIDSVNPHGGKYALKIGSGGGGTGYGITSGFNAGEKYTLNAYGKLSGKIAPWHASFCIQFIDKDGKKTNFVSSDISDSVAYQKKSVTATVPVGTVKILPNIWYDGFGNSTVLIDDIEFVAATEAVTSVKVNPSQLAMFANSTSQLTDSIFPATASNKNVSWSSSDTTVVKVNSAGLLTGKAVGTATVTVTTADGSKTSTCAVTVSAASLISNPGFEEKLKGWDDWGGLSIDSVNVHGGKYALKIASSGGGTGYGITSGFSVGQKYVLSGYGKLSSKIAPWHASFCIQFIDSTGKKTNFVSTDLSDSVAYQLKTVTATVPAGTAKILPNIWYDGFGTSTVLVDDISFGLAPAVLVTDVVVSAVAVPLAVGSTFQLSATVNPSNAGNKNIVWSTSDVTLAEVDKSGLVTAKAAGVVTITVTSEEGKKTAICTVTITSSATRVNDLKNIPGNSIIYPNPLQGNLLQINTVGIQGVKTISVFDMSGRMIFSKKLQEADYQTLDLSGLQLIGSYIVKISTDKQTVSKVLIAQ